ncbi:hypothetical protein [Nonomuraea sp. SYSU D8015]|uniref:hypothetical protein n=1 Tax=Nonomuraea sp. SYSU D8015 TaxID=2593644 RepID=UPI001660A930|nr:hypothetical protein [Nonomuraea sp. SYSU D8015]
MRPLQRLRADLSTGKNLEIYLTATIALVVGVLGVFSIVKPDIVGAATLAVLALVAVNALGPRHQVADLEARVAELNRLVEARMAGDSFLTAVRKGLDERVARAGDIRFAGVTLSRTVRAHVDDLRKSLGRGASVKVLLIDPKGTVPEEAARRSTIPDHADVFEHRVESTIYLLRDLKDSIEVRFMPFVPAFGLVLLDADDDDGVIHVELGTHSAAGRDPVFTLTPRRDHFWFEHFKGEFDRMWEVSREATEADWYPRKRS